jgi:hypothetical protein
MGMPKLHYFSTIPASEIPGIRTGNVPDEFRCTARARVSGGERCRCVAVKGKGVCRHHGGGGKKLSLAKMYRMAARLRGERPEHYED